MDGSNSDMVFLRLLRRAVYFSSELREAVWGRGWRRQCRNQFHTARLGQCSHSSLHQQQASAFAYFDVFLMLTVVTLGLVPVVLLVKRLVARKARIAGE
jgi:hypothetical protein